MFKKTLLLVGVILAVNSNAALAYGTYMGLGLGWNSTSYQLKDSTNTNYQYNVRYPTVGVFVGDGAIIKKNFYLAGELFLNGGTGATSYRNIDNNTVNANVNSTYTYGADVIPGYTLGREKETLLYGRAGLALSRMQLRGYLTQNGINMGTPDAGTVPRTFAGLRLGLGVQQSFSKIIKARVDYIHTTYRGLGVMDTAGIRDHLKPTSNQFSLALIYEFVK